MSNQQNDRTTLPPNVLQLVATVVVLLWPTLGIADDDNIGAKGNEQFFEAKVRPLLANECFSCHGEKKQESGLRLDSRIAVLKGGDNGPAVSVKTPQTSLLLSAVKREGEIKMPPEKDLSADQVRILETWITNGVFWPAEKGSGSEDARMKHWAFQPISRPVTPNVEGDWVTNPIDQFILAKMRTKGLSPAPPADRITLIRRATFDLIGLPPTPDEIDAFVGDESKDAFEKLVDRLLDSPHYGERWGRYWLDVARYADNKGYVFFEEKTHPWAWTYRDWVVRALNEDLPYDQFVVQQVAADKLELGEDKRPLAAMGYLTVGARFVNNTHDIIDDQIDVVTRGFMGLTVTCARCHDHKFDPIPQADYYSLYGVFRSSSEPILQPAFMPPQKKEGYEEYEKGLQERYDKYEQFVAQQRTMLRNDARERAAEYLMAVHRKRNHPTTENFMLLTDKGAIIPAMIHRWEVYLKQAAKLRDPVWSVWHAFGKLDDDKFAQQAESVHRSLFAEEQEVKIEINPLVAEEFSKAAPASMDEVAKKYDRLLKKVYVQIQDKDKDKAVTEGNESAFDQLRLVLDGPRAPGMIPRSLGWGFLDLLPDRPTQNEYKKLIKELEQFSMNATSPPRAMVLLDTDQAYDAHIFLRGNPNRHGRAVPRRFLKLTAKEHPQQFQDGSGRLELAKAIVGPLNPLTSRVAVNRVWQHHFGRGIVDTPSDFGLQGSLPSHPQLLDWLAGKFMDDGWSLKRLHKLIMLSSTYQLSSRATEGQRESDPENVFLSRFHRRRLGFEAMRDSMVAVTGRLDHNIGGRPVQLLKGFNARRSIYGFINRMDVPGVLRNFDFPEPISTSSQRIATTVPTQALYFLNHQFVRECGEKVLQRQDVVSQPDDRARVDRIYKILLARKPTETETNLGLEYVHRKSTSTTSHWSFGYGSVDDTKKRVLSFAKFPHWTGERWQGGARLPDGKLGWLFMTADGGHPASSYDRCCIRRWRSPFDGVVTVSGEFSHEVDMGNGVRGRIVSSRKGVVGEWKVHNSKLATKVASLEVKRGDTIDWVVDFQDNIVHDEHFWKVMVTRTDGSEAKKFDSIAEFYGGKSDLWSNYVHALLMTNEFLFIE